MGSFSWLKADNTTKVVNVAYGKPKKIMTKIDKIFDDFESRTCENCKFLDVGPYDMCPIAEPLIRQYLNYDESTFSCNRWRLKDA